MSSRKTYLKWILSIALLVITTFSFAWFYYQRSPFVEVKAESKLEMDPKADQLLKEMSTSLKNLKEFSFRAEGYFEVIDSTGKKEKMDNSGQAFVKRPDKIKIQRTGEKSDAEFYCDGKEVTVYEKNHNVYASAPAEANLDKTFDAIRDRLDIELPATDLLYTDVYDGLMQDVIASKYMGSEKIENKDCEHLSFTGKEVDWQIWIEKDKKLPMKYLIISKNIEGKPQASVEIKEWRPSVLLNDKMFSFKAPKGAKKIEFLPVPDSQTQSKNE